jgi:flagellar biosynthesis/type III secretory pathway M-ring protein FliF/YscJ
MQNIATQELKLHDIKPLLEIEEFSFYYFLVVVVLVTFLFVGFAFLIIKWFQKRKRFDKRKEHKKAFMQVDLRNAKEAAYALTKYGATFANDSERHQKIYNELLDTLAKYKYKKEIDEKFDSNTERLIELYKGMIDA